MNIVGVESNLFTGQVNCRQSSVTCKSCDLTRSEGQDFGRFRIGNQTCHAFQHNTAEKPVTTDKGLLSTFVEFWSLLASRQTRQVHLIAFVAKLARPDFAVSHVPNESSRADLESFCPSARGVGL